MRKCRKVNKMVYIGILVAVVLCAVCGCEAEPESAYRTEDEQDTICCSEVELESEYGAESDQDVVSGSTGVSPDVYKTESDRESVEIKQQFTYFINWEGHFSYPSEVYHIGEVETQPYFVPVLLVKIPDDRQKEERINRMLLEHYVEVLPDAEEEDWWRMQEIRITYRSERYFCFRYVSNTSLPEGCDYYNLYITLDLQQEKIIPYPVLAENVEKYNPCDYWGCVYREMEVYQEKTVAEQSALRGEPSYEVQMITAECDGIVFSCVGIDGMSDEEKQNKINGILQEPIRTCIMNEGWKTDSEKQELFENVKIYIAYQSEEWLSVIYSIKVDNLNKVSDGEADFGVTVNLQSGERVMLDDLFEIDDLMTWMYACGRYQEDSRSMRELGFLLTEEEILSYVRGGDFYFYKGELFVGRYADRLDTFYLYEGQLVILRNGGSFEILLPEIYEYLKVDPWY